MRGFIGDSCVGAEDIDGAEVGLGFFDAGCYGAFVGDVALDVEDVGRWWSVEWQEVVSCDFASRSC